MLCLRPYSLNASSSCEGRAPSQIFKVFFVCVLHYGASDKENADFCNGNLQMNCRGLNFDVAN